MVLNHARIAGTARLERPEILVRSPSSDILFSEGPDESNDPAYNGPSQEDIQQDDCRRVSGFPDQRDDGWQQIYYDTEETEFPHATRLAPDGLRAGIETFQPHPLQVTLCEGS